MRNVILIHLESLNYMNYQVNKSFFPTLRKWEQNSLSFSKFFSTATSTMMVMSDLAYGGMLQNEPCESLKDGLRKYCYQGSFLDKLKENGYQVKIAGYPTDDLVEDEMVECNQRHFMGYTVEMNGLRSYKAYKESLEDAITTKTPFAVWTCNYINNVSYNSGMENIGSQTGLERWESGYLYMDQCVHDLMGILEKKDLLEQTTVIFYGDHGDDLFSHGRHEGLMHAIEPYETLIHTPFWIYDSRFAPETISVLIDTTDIRGIVEQLLCLPEQNLEIKDLRLPTRKYSLSRNLYAAQKVRETSFHKAYSLTDGRFLFMAGDRGMELYHIVMDAPCQHNLLDYFDFDGNILSLNKAAYGRAAFHFLSLMDELSLLQIERVFYEYRKQLMKEVKSLYEYAEWQWLSVEIKFDRIHYGWEERERRQNAGTQELDWGVANRIEIDVYERYLEGKRIVLYGAGKYGRYFYEKRKDHVEIAAWVDGNYEQVPCIFGQRIQTPDCINEIQFDVVFIAVMNVKARWEIKEKLMQMGVPKEKIF